VRRRRLTWARASPLWRGHDAELTHQIQLVPLLPLLCDLPLGQAEKLGWWIAPVSRWAGFLATPPVASPRPSSAPRRRPVLRAVSSLQIRRSRLIERREPRCRAGSPPPVGCNCWIPFLTCTFVIPAFCRPGRRVCPRSGRLRGPPRAVSQEPTAHLERVPSEAGPGDLGIRLPSPACWLAPISPSDSPDRPRERLRRRDPGGLAAGLARGLVDEIVLDNLDSPGERRSCRAARPPSGRDRDLEPRRCACPHER
jgi:hypothetical protein